jgi:hypothetical protein
MAKHDMAKELFKAPVMRAKREAKIDVEIKSI